MPSSDLASVAAPPQDATAGLSRSLRARHVVMISMGGIACVAVVRRRGSCGGAPRGREPRLSPESRPPLADLGGLLERVRDLQHA